jgi:hypothetical protein
MADQDADDDKDDGKSGKQKIIDAAKDFLKRAMEAETENRQEALIALKFSKLGEQWQANDVQSRQLEARPCLTINKIEAYCTQVTNQQRQQRPRIKVHAVDNGADKKIAEIIAGICRHIEVNSAADTAYDTAFDSAVHIGWGYWRIRHDYIKEDSFDQDIFIETIDNPFSVYFDPMSTLPDGSDAQFCLITDQLTKAQFRQMYPGKDDGSSFNNTGQGDEMAEWISADNVRIAEYFYVESKPATLVMLSNSQTAWKDELPKAPAMLPDGATIVAERASHKRVVKWCKLTAMEVLEERVWPGRWIPVIPVYGERVVIEGKRRKFGLVKHAMDPQRMYNFWRTATTEAVALAPKAKWLMADGQDEGYENEWAQANIATYPVLHYKQVDSEGHATPPPQRLQPEPPPSGAIEAAMLIGEDLSAVLGIVEPAQRIGGNVSGKALNSEKQQSDNATFNYYDNLTRSICHTGKIIVDLIPRIYDNQRVVRILGEDGRPDQVTINQRSEVDEVLNNVTVGQYDVVMDTGPGYNSKRQEAVEAFTNILNSPLGEEVARVGADLAIRSMDFAGSDTLADRLAAANPLAQIDEKSDVPPQAQMQIKSLQQQLEQAVQQIQQLEMEQKYKMGVVQAQEAGATQREHIKATVKAHDTESRDNAKLQANREDNAAWMQDSQTKAHTALSVAEINAVKDILRDKLGAEAAEKLAMKADEEERELETA